jgi:polyferredoxin
MNGEVAALFWTLAGVVSGLGVLAFVAVVRRPAWLAPRTATVVLVGVASPLAAVVAWTFPALSTAVGAAVVGAGALAAAIWSVRSTGKTTPDLQGTGKWLRANARPATLLNGASLFLLVVGCDLVLGSWSVAAGMARSVTPLASPLDAVIASVLSPAFLLTAAAQMFAVAVVAAPGLDARMRAILAAPAALILLTPTALPSGAWGPVAVYVGSAVFVVVFVTALQFMYRSRQIAPSVSRFLVRWGAVGTVLTAAWLAWYLDGSSILLAPAVLLELTLVLTTVLGRPEPEKEPRLPWLLHPFWVFEILLFTFLAEFFLGASLDREIAGSSFLQYIPFLPLPGTLLGALGPAVYDGLWFAAAVLSSAWFLLVIGCTMGALVVFKIRETHERALRYRLALMIAVYGLAVVYLPSFASSTPLLSVPALANIPVIGWGFGLRSGGPFESGVFLAIIVMYATVGVLTVLFGRKALCSVMCGAALMYQGTAVNEMRKFNQTSRVGRYFLGSQLSTAYAVASSLALVSLFATSFLSFFHMLPRVQVASGQFDTSALPLPIELYFGALWFVMFVSTPYIGTYSCATTGFCHWGALSLPFAKVGLFRLKVKDRTVCQRCTTFDCAKACPVGLVDMPEHFRTTGEFRSTKCCGVGNCIGACPYGNMYEQDVRLWIVRAFHRVRPQNRGTPLPMIHASAPVGARRAGPDTAAGDHV